MAKDKALLRAVIGMSHCVREKKECHRLAPEQDRHEQRQTQANQDSSANPDSHAEAKATHHGLSADRHKEGQEINSSRVREQRYERQETHE